MIIISISGAKHKPVAGKKCRKPNSEWTPLSCHLNRREVLVSVFRVELKNSSVVDISDRNRNRSKYKRPRMWQSGMLIWFLDFTSLTSTSTSTSLHPTALQCISIFWTPSQTLQVYGGWHACDFDGLLVKDRLGVAAVGHCSGSQLKPQNWVARATAPHISPLSPHFCGSMGFHSMARERKRERVRASASTKQVRKSIMVGWAERHRNRFEKPFSRKRI